MLTKIIILVVLLSIGGINVAKTILLMSKNKKNMPEVIRASKFVNFLMTIFITLIYSIPVLGWWFHSQMYSSLVEDFKKRGEKKVEDREDYINTLMNNQFNGLACAGVMCSINHQREIMLKNDFEVVYVENRMDYAIEIIKGYEEIGMLREHQKEMYDMLVELDKFYSLLIRKMKSKETKSNELAENYLREKAKSFSDTTKTMREELKKLLP